jgi:hypothetical protein
MVATLPSGEALAIASSLQCVINIQQGAQDSPDAITPSPDNYLRVPGKLQIWSSSTSQADGGAGVGLVEVYRFPDQDGQEIVIVGLNENTTPGQFAPPGTWFDTNTGGFLVSSTDVYFLRLFGTAQNPILSAADVAIDPATGLATGCTIDLPSGPNSWMSPPAPRPGPDGTIGRDCVYPLALPETDPQAPGNIPLSASCLGSFPTPAP